MSKVKYTQDHFDDTGESKELEALEEIKRRIFVTEKELKKYGNYRVAVDNLEEYNTIKQALEEKEQQDKELSELRRSNKEMRKQLDEAYSKMPHANNCSVGGKR